MPLLNNAGLKVLTLETGLYLRVQELPDGPSPQPLRSGFSSGVAYRALGMFNPSETSDAYFIFSNDRDEIWFICNRHLRLVGVLPNQLAARLPLASAQAWVVAGAPVKKDGGPLSTDAEANANGNTNTSTNGNGNGNGNTNRHPAPVRAALSA